MAIDQADGTKETGHKVPAGVFIACEYAVVGRAKKIIRMSHGWAVRSNNCLFGVYVTNVTYTEAARVQIWPWKGPVSVTNVTYTEAMCGQI